MSDLNEQIRRAQVSAAENIVIASLQKSGLVAKEPQPETEPNGLPLGVKIDTVDLACWFRQALQPSIPTPHIVTAERALSVIPIRDMLACMERVVEQLRRKLMNYEREEAATALNEIADMLTLGSGVRDPQTVAFAVRQKLAELTQYREAFAAGVGAELERIAPGGKLV
jgi:hypothetical protein